MISKEAVWICHPDDTKANPLIPVFRKSFEVRHGLLSASLAVTSHGIYHTEINGRKVTDHLFTPGFTSYYHRIQFQTYDITNLVNEGTNIWQTTVGDGWWRWHNNFGYTLALKGEITLRYEDRTERIPTDETFEASAGKLISSDYLKGEVFDNRVEINHRVKAAVCHEHTEGKLIETEGVPVSEHEVFEGKPFKDASGNLVVDFGQNIAGYVAMKLHNTKPGQRVHLKHGEGLDPGGSFSTANCDGRMETFQEITYICKGAETEEYRPYFTWFGFRYVLVEGIEDAEFKAIAVYSDMEETGDFRCSNDLINKLVENARWSQKGNFLDVATGCPTREKNAWTGDAAVYCRTSAYFMNVKAFYEKWLKDQAIEQYASGKLGITFPSTSSVHNPDELTEVQKTRPDMALAGPEGEGNIGEDSVGWGDSAVIIPCQLYQMYGDKTILENHYETAKRWVNFSLDGMKETNPLYQEEEWYRNGEGDLVYDTRFHYGEWNEPLPPSKEVIELFANGGKPEDFVRHMAKYGKPETATACTKHSCDLLACMAELLGKKEDAAFYHQKAASLKYAYDRYLIKEDGTIQKGHQAAYVRALAYDMVSEEKKPL
ncbi:MAG: family 78 glycoside hydrolase catalytic domain, partial [Solobacterium sp.]|nr:family 78 glycoside hydrolase catalytic domain [Solobacterium sp.]